MANSVLAKMAVQISANTAEFNKALQSTSNNLKSFTSGLQKIATQVGIAFSVQQVAEFTLEVSKLSGEAEAVRRAFENLPNSIRLMNDLKEATHGTVSELDLMKRSVQAANFDISLEALPRLLEFATLRAQQTGQSVDYLVDSIVTGIGRKSKLILDNLGISAAQLSEELKGASTEASTVGEVADAVGRIAEKSLKNMVGFSDNAATSLQKLSASWTNLKVAIGDAVNSGGFMQGLIDTLTRFFDIFSSDNLTKMQKFQTYLVAAFMPQKLSEFTAALKKLDDEIERNKQATEESADRLNKFDAQTLINKYNGIQAAIEGFTKSFENLKNQDLSKLTESELRQFTNYEAILKILNQRLQQTVTGNENVAQSIAKINTEIQRFRTNIPDFSGSLSRATLPGFFEKQDIRNQGFLQGVGELVPPDISKFRDAADEIRGIQADLSSSTADFVSSMAESLGNALAGNENFGQSFLKAVARFGQNFGKQLVALGIAQIAFKKSFSNPYAAVAAGAALIVASSIISKTVSSFNVGGGGNVGYVGSGGSGISAGGSKISGNAGQNQFSVETVIRGQDIYVSLSNYQKNRSRTSAING